MQKVKLIIGLGNDGKKYADTYHNVGRLFIDHLMRGADREHPWRAMKNEGFMNEAGIFVKEAVKKTKIKPEELLIVHDESDLEIGKYKLSFGRGAAGHHGIESIVQHLGTKNFWRLRIGIRRPPRADSVREKAEKFVLKKITARDKKILEAMFTEASRANIFYFQK